MGPRQQAQKFHRPKNRFMRELKIRAELSADFPRE